MEPNYPLTGDVIRECVKLALPTAYGIRHHDELKVILAQLEDGARLGFLDEMATVDQEFE